MHFKTVLALSMVAIITIAASATEAIAEIKPEDEIKFRQSGMMFMRWNMGKIKQQVGANPQRYNKEEVIAAANVIAAIANSGMGALFSSNTRTGKGWKDTRLKAEYFSQPEEVKKQASAFSQEANELVKVANSADQTLIKNQFDKLFKACKSCHKKFRRKD